MATSSSIPITTSSLPDDISEESIKQILDEADDVIIDQISINNIGRFISQFQKRIKKNQEDRIKHSDDPQKWLKSEVDLDEEIRKFKQIAVLPEIYEEVIKTNLFQLLINLLNHINNDIAIEVVEVISEIIDVEDLDSNVEERFLQHLIDCQLPEALVETMFRINEDESEEDYTCISKCLLIIEAFVRGNMCEMFVKSGRLMTWIVKRLRVNNNTDYNRVYTSEIFAQLLYKTNKQITNYTNKQTNDIFDRLLRSIAHYRKIQIQTTQEEELINNLFDCLHALLQIPQFVPIFVNAQGLELMIRLMKRGDVMCRAVMKVLTETLINSQEHCKLFVDKLGLKLIFSLLMNKGIKRHKDLEEGRLFDERVTFSILCLCVFCRGTPLARVLNKFTENNFEKIERILELHETYSKRLEDLSLLDTQEKILAFQHKYNSDVYFMCLSNGLFVLQNCDATIVVLATMGNSEVTNRMVVLLQNKGISIDEVCENALEVDQRIRNNTNVEKLVEDFRQITNEILGNEETNE